MGASYYEISTEVVEQIASVASEAAIRAIAAEEEKAKKRRKHDKHKRSYDILSSYRRMKKVIENGKTFSPQEQAEIRWSFIEDLMGDGIHASIPDRIIKDEDQKLQENIYGVYRIETALKMYEDEVDKTDVEERKRRFRLLKARFFDDEEIGVPEMAAREGISEKTVYKDISMAVDIMAIYMAI